MDACADPVKGLFACPPDGTATRRPFAPVPDDARPYAVRMRDGVLLATDVYLPDRGRRWPVLLSRVPYDKAGDECHMPSNARWFTERGYAVVVQDVRGKVRSGGALAPFRSEIVDGYDTIEWITEQQWCAGPIGMFGDSYFGWTQWAAAASQHPALRAITPRVISADIGDLTSRQGLFSLEVSALWALETWVDEALYAYEGQLDWSVRPLSEVVPTVLGGRRSAFLDEVGADRLPDAARLPVRADLPALHVGGWWDIIQRGQIATWREARSTWRAPQYLVMDARDHGWTGLRGPGEPYVDPRTDDTTMQTFLDDYLGTLLPFLDHFVAGTDTYDAPPVRWKLAGGTWRESDAWPPLDSRPVDWFLTGSARGALTATPDRCERPLAWTHDPHDPVPSISHAYHPLIEPADESARERRDDVLIFDTDPLRVPLDLAGPASVTMSLSSDATSTHLMATVSDVAPDGTARKILDGAYLAAAPWPHEATIDLGNAGYRLLPGHRLRLALSSSEFPRYAVHPGTSADPWTARDHRRTEQQIVLGGARAARLRCFALERSGETA
ncbi:MAG: CocE/NonD family hydrolase [Nocardioidaceae bacterium]